MVRKNKGWSNEPIRHGLASQGVKTTVPDVSIGEEASLFLKSDFIRSLEFLCYDKKQGISFRLKAYPGSIKRSRNTILSVEKKGDRRIFRGDIYFPLSTDKEELCNRLAKTIRHLSRLDYNMDVRIKDPHGQGLYRCFLSFQKDITDEELRNSLAGVYYGIEKFYQGGKDER